MDLATLLGFAAAIALVVGGALIEGLHLGSLVGPTAFMIVVGGTLGATVMSHTSQDLKHLRAALKRTIIPVKLDYPGTIEYLENLATKARKSGLLALQEDAATAPHPLIARGITLVVDGGDPDSIEDVLSSMIKLQGEELLHGAAVCETAGGYCPTLGIMGTVMGLIHIMGNLSEPDALGPSIAVAFLATFYGVAFANLVFLPWATKIKLAVKQESRFGEMVLQGIIGIQTGASPRNLTERLTVFMGTHAKPKGGTES